MFGTTMIIRKFSLLLIFITIEDVNLYKINKCCPLGETLDRSLTCAPTHLTNFLVDLQDAQRNDINYGSAPCDLSINKFSPYFHIGNDGRLVLTNADEEYSPEAYCLETSAKNVTVAFLCPCIGKAVCLKKCCRAGREFYIDPNMAADCVRNNNGEDWSYDVIFENKTVNYGTIYTIIECGEKQRLFLNSSYEIYEDGTLYSEEGGLVEADDYCVDYENSTEKEIKVLACLGAPPLKAESYIVAVFGMLGVVLFALTTFIYLFIPGLPWLSSRMLGMHTASMTIASIILVINSTNSSSRGIFCHFLGFSMQLSFLAAFFWLNVMCVDVSWTFTGLKTQAGQKYNDRRKFLIYSIYAWGCSSIWTLLAVIIEVLPSVPETSSFKPNMAVTKCWFNDDAPLYIFFYGPIGILVLINLILFVYTSLRIFVLKKGTKAIQQPDSERHGKKRNKQRFILYAKLFSMMGVTWITEIISYAIGENYGLQYLWYITDTINLLRAVFIFVIFCCKAKIWSNITKEYPRMKNCEVLFKGWPCNKRDVCEIADETRTTSSNVTQESDINTIEMRSQ